MNVNKNAGNEAGNMGPWGWEHGIAPGICTTGPGMGDWGHGWEHGPWDRTENYFPIGWVSLMSIHSSKSAIVYFRLVSDHTAMKNNVLE